jgi:DNA-binding MarR family transcriptional regulator
MEAIDWETVSALARRRGVDKSAISRRVARYEAQGLLKTRPGGGGRKLVNVAEFDRVAAETTDAVRELNGSAGGARLASSTTDATPGDPILAKEQARRAAYGADLKKLDLEERLGNLVSLAKVTEAQAICAQRIVQVIERMTERAHDAASRAALKQLARDVRDELANAMALIADEDEDEAQTVAETAEAR